MQMYKSAARHARYKGLDKPRRSYKNQIKVPQDPTSGSDQKAINDSLKFDFRLVMSSLNEMRMKKMRAVPTNGKYHITSSRHSSPFTM